MDFLREAHESSTKNSCVLIRSVFFQTSRLALQKILEKRKNEPLEIGAAAAAVQGGGGEEEEDASPTTTKLVFHVTQEDIDQVYKITEEVGQKWKMKLEMSGEDELSTLVGIVLANGRFLEEVNDDNDDNNDSRTTQDLLFQQHIMDVNSHDDDDDDDDDLSIHDDGNNNNRTKKSTEQEANNDIQKAITMFQSYSPYVALSKVGGFNATVDASISSSSSSSSSSIMIGESNDWKPLPPSTNGNEDHTHTNEQELSTLPSSSISSSTNNNTNTNTNIRNQNHIPTCTMLPVHKIKTSLKDQLYGHPLPTLKEHCHAFKCYVNNNTSNNKEYESRIKATIQLIDALGYSNHTNWYYNWNTIENAVMRNRKRIQTIQLPKRKKRKFIHARNEEGKEEETDVIVIEEGDSQEQLLQLKQQNDDNAISTNNNNNSSNTNITNEYGISDKGTRKRKNNDLNTNEIIVEGCCTAPRHASTFDGSVQWSWDEIKDTFTSNEIRTLYKTMIHDEYNSDIDMENDSVHDESMILQGSHDQINALGDDEGTAVNCHKCMGALKMVGSFHLWEQLRHHDNWNGPREDSPSSCPIDTTVNHNDGNNQRHIQKRRKKAFAKAKRQRLYPNIELKKVDKLSKLSTKVAFTHSSGKYNMELDLGECMMNLCVKRSSGSKNDRNKGIQMRNFHFRSLEILLEE